MSFFKKFFIGPFIAGRAYSKIHKRQYTKAIPLFKKLIKIDPDHYRQGYELINLAHCYYELERYTEALKNFELAYLFFENSNDNYIMDSDDQKMISYCIDKYILLLKNEGKNDSAIEIEKNKNNILKIN